MLTCLLRLRRDEHPPARKSLLKSFRLMLFVTATAAVAFCSPDGVLENVTKIQVDPTVVTNPEKVNDSAAANLLRFDLRAALMHEHLEEGSSPIRIHIVLDQFSSLQSTSKVRRVLNLGASKTENLVDGKLVILDAGGKQLASREIHFHGNVGLNPDDNADPQHRQSTSDFEQLMIDELERLK
jgi:hypothetical protein